jgi:hypothetical protein
MSPMSSPTLASRLHLLAVFARARWGATALALLATLGVTALRAQSLYPQKPDDPRAVEFNAAAGAKADGIADDADALQAAINRIQGAGVVLIPEGRYRLGKTVYVSQGIRLIGYGKNRPVFVLGANTPGFQEGTGRYVVHFTNQRVQPGQPIADGSEFTFYSGMSNIDFDLQDGNPAAIAVRFHVAQHSMLTYMDFKVGSARAAVEDIGNQITNVRIHGGDYGIITRRTAPVWQFLLMDSSLDGQRLAGVQTMDAGFTLVRVAFANMPVALKIFPGEVEQLYARDLRLENVSTAALEVGDWQNHHSAITLANVSCSNVPRFTAGDHPVAAPGPHYVVENFSLGLAIGPDGREAGVKFAHRERAVASAVPLPPSDIPALPPMEKWVNVRSLGVQGGNVDDTDALQKAVNDHPVLFFPAGTYHVRSSLKLRPDSVLIGLNPNTTAIGLIDGSADFAGEGDPIGVVSAPSGGKNIIVSMGVGTGTSNPRAAAVLWRAGKDSMLDDVTFPGGLGGLGAGGRGRGAPGAAPAPAAPARGPAAAIPGPQVFAAAAQPPARGGAAPARGTPGRGPGGNTRNSQAGDLIITDGGGGIFRGCWPHDPNAKIGLRVANTSTPGKIYQMSVEHHYRVEVELHNVKNWEIYALQTEEENPDGADAYAVDFQDSSDLLIANTYIYRVSRNIRSKPYAIMARRSTNILLQNMKVFSQTRLAFDNTVLEEGSGVTVRPNFFTSFTINRDLKTPAPLAPPAGVFERGVALEKLTTGYSNASGLTVDDKGTVYFTDAAENKIYRWDAAGKKADVLATTTGPQPQVLGFVPPSHLLAVAMTARPAARAVYHLDLNQPGSGATTLTETADLLPGTSLLLPVGLHYQLGVLRDLLGHRGYVFQNGSNTAVISVVADQPRGYYYAPGTTTAIIAGGSWRPNIESSNLAALKPGDSHHLTSEDDGLTYVATLGQDYRSISTTVFARRGGTSVATDSAGNVYVAEGHVWIYDRTGKELGVLETPERPGSLAFGGPDKKTLFIGARTSLYSIRTQAAGK